jgi:hypothetical protein
MPASVAPACPLRRRARPTPALLRAGSPDRRARLAPARISIAAAAARVIDVSGMAFSKPLRTAIAIVATDRSASTDPIPTATGSWYLAARPAVRI